MLRGVQEMGVTGRTLLGLMVFPRGVMNIALKNGIEPMMSHQPRRFWSGVKTILKLIAGTTIADRISEKVTGRSAYDLIQIVFGYSLLSPGASTIVDMFKQTSDIAYQGRSQDASASDIAKRMLVAASSQLETFIPMCDVLIDEYKMRKEYEYVNLYTIARSMGMSEWEKMNKKPFKYKDRDIIDKVRLMFFESDPKDKKSEWEALGKALSNRNSSKLK